MSDKNFMSFEDAEEVLGTFAERIKSDEYEEITYQTWSAMTDEEKETGNYLVSGVPNADGKVTINGCTMLWFNDGTVTSMATGDTITLNDDYSNYDFLYVTASWPQLTSSSINASCIMDVQHLKMEFLSVADTTTGGVQNARRILGFDSDTKKIKVYDCYRCQGSVAQSTQNDYLVPRRIYGIKLNHQLEIQAIARDVSTSADKCMLSDGETSVEDVMPENVGLENLLISADQLKTRFSSISGSSTYESTYMVTASALNGYIKTAWDALGTGTSGVKVISIGGPACGMLYYKHSDAVGGACILFGYTLTKPIYCNIGANGVVHNSYYL